MAYNSVSEMVKNLVEDKEFQAEFERELANKKLAKTLFAMRCAQGITQSEIALRMNCTQGRISKLENSGIDGIRVGDLVLYAKALNLQTSIGFEKDIKTVDRVKYHAFQIKKHLDQLADLAHQDDQIFYGVLKFYKEYLFNTLELFKKSFDKLTKKVKMERPVLEICTPTGEENNLFIKNANK